MSSLKCGNGWTLPIAACSSTSTSSKRLRACLSNHATDPFLNNVYSPPQAITRIEENLIRDKNPTCAGLAFVSECKKVKGGRAACVNSCTDKNGLLSTFSSVHYKCQYINGECTSNGTHLCCYTTLRTKIWRSIDARMCAANVRQSCMNAGGYSTCEGRDWRGNKQAS